MKKVLRAINAALPTLLLTAGAALIAGGVMMVSIPAGLVTAGCLSIAIGVLMLRGGAR